MTTDELRAMLKESGLTIRQFADAAGVTERTVYNMLKRGSIPDEASNKGPQPILAIAARTAVDKAIETARLGAADKE